MSILVFLIGIAIFFDCLLYFFNHYYPFWYAVISLILVAPYLVGLLVIFQWWGTDNAENRSRLVAAGYLCIATVVLITLWVAIYLYGFQDSKEVHVGFGTKKDHSNYYSQTKLYTLVWYCISGLLLIIILLYWQYLVQSRYVSLYPKEE